MRGNNFVFFIAVLVLSVTFAMFTIEKTHAQPTVEWSKTFGGLDDEGPYSVLQTSDGGYIIVGYTWSFKERADKSDVYLVKTDPDGNLEWNKTFGGSESDLGRSVLQTSDGGYMIAGNTESFGAGNHDVYLVKTDSEGNLVWNKTYGGSGDDVGYSVQQTSDGGYIIGGMTESFGKGYSDVYLVKTDSDGNMLWDKSLGGSQGDQGRSVQQTSDGGYIIAGDTTSFGTGSDDIYLVKTDSDGNMLWNKTFGGPKFDTGRSVLQTSDGGYIITGHIWIQRRESEHMNGDDDIYLVKTDPDGNLMWNKTYGGSSYINFERGRSVQQTSDGGYIITGTLLIKTDSEGDLLWNKTLSGSSVQQTSDGGYIIAGSTKSFGAGGYDFYLVKLAPLLGAIAGADQIVGEDTLVVLNGSASTTNNSITSYEWTFMDVTSQTLMGEAVSYYFADPGVYVVTLNVTDTSGNFDLDTVTITVNDVTVPSAVAGPDQTVDEDTVVTLDGSSSTDNMEIASYEWTFTDGTPKILTGMNPNYTFNTPGAYEVTLNVTDTSGSFYTDTVTITVNDVTNPSANAGNNETVKVNTEVSFNGNISSDNVEIVSYEWDFGDETIGSGKTATHAYTQAGTYIVTLTVSDLGENSDTDTITITVEAEPEFPWSIIGIGTAITAAALAIIYFKTTRKPF